jgi:hypothetical protein
LTSLRHEEPDRVPVDFLATPDVWDKLVAHVAPETPVENILAMYDVELRYRR